MRKGMLVPTRTVLALCLALGVVGCKSIAGYDDVHTDGPADAIAPIGDGGSADGDGAISDGAISDGATEDGATDGAIDGAGVVPPTPSRPGQLVSADGWIWEHPFPQGNAIHAFHGFGDDDIWGVGALGTIVHVRVNSTGWTASAEPIPWSDPNNPPPTLMGLWGSSSTDLWAVGDGGVIFRRTGSGWQRETSPTTEPLRAIWGSGPNDVHLVGGQVSVTLHSAVWQRYDGTSWSSLLDGNTVVGQALHDVWGSDPTSVWAVGEQGDLVHFDGAGLTAHNSSADSLRAVVGDSQGAIWVGTASNTAPLLSYAQESWTVPTLTIGGFYLFGMVRGGVGDDLFAVGQVRASAETGLALQRVEGGAWGELTPKPPTAALLSAWGLSSGELLAAGIDGTLVRYHGGSGWRALQAASQRAIYAIFRPPGGPLWAVGAGGATLRQKADGAWEQVDSGTPDDLLALWGSGRDALWAGGKDRTLLRFTGSAWQPVDVSSVASPTTAVRAIWGTGPTDLWIAGGTSSVPLLAHYDGQSWQAQSADGVTGPLNGLWGTGSDNVWVVGGLYYTTCHYQGATWTCESHGGAPNDTLTAIHGLSPQKIWAVGTQGAIFGYDGTRWVPLLNGDPMLPKRSLRSLFALSEEEAFAAGDDGLVLHLSAGAWRPEDAAVTHDLFAVTHLANGETFIAGDHAAILRRPAP